MSQIVLNTPDGDSCVGCSYRIRRTDINEEAYHCSIFGTRGECKAKNCKEATIPTKLKED